MIKLFGGCSMQKNKKNKKSENVLKLFLMFVFKYNRNKLNLYVDISAECMAKLDGKSYKRRKNIMRYYFKALRLMRFAKKNGCSYYAYARRKYYNLSTKQEILDNIEKYNKYQLRYVKIMAKDAGISYDEAKKEMDDAIKKYRVLDYRKYALYQFFTFTDQELSDRMKLWKDNYRKQVTCIVKHTKWSRKKAQRMMERASLIYDIDPGLYVLYQGWKLSDKQLDSYANKATSKKLQQIYNSKECVKVMNDKLLFAQKYEKYINRKVWINDKTASYESFKKFAKDLKYVFCKPISCGGGNGALKIDVPSDEKKLKQLYEDLMKKTRLLVEEGIIQHYEIDEFVSNCVNTLRVVSIRTNDEVKILCANMKFGRVGIIADNLSRGGLVADVDLETGVIVTKGVDEFDGRFIYHPDTNKQILGFKIPNWDKLKDFIEKAMKAYDGVGYIGWDIAITEKGFAIIEGNTVPDLCLVQAPYYEYQVGKKYLFTPYLKNDIK